jgi:hypothetical protein
MNETSCPETSPVQKTICVYTILYTLATASPAENKYIPIFILWLTQLLRSGGLTTTDRIEVAIDQDTYEWMLNNSILSSLLALTPTPIHFRTMKQPATHLEGMMWKYVSFNYTEDIFFYTDIDILVTNSLHPLVNRMESNKMYVVAEGTIHHPNYGADIDPVFLKSLPDFYPGLSAGKFFITNKELHTSVCRHINTRNKYPTTFYTVDQPLFNSGLLPVEHIDIHLLVAPIVALNQDEYSRQSTVLLDFAGEPANGIVHLESMQDAYSLLHTGLY